MKIKQIYIENFGMFSKYSHSFKDNLEVFLENNGEGKTTLSSFIKAMFYGMDSIRNNKFDERSHFYPFNKGKYGGYIVFDYENKEYKIERYFDSKSETKDEKILYCNGHEKQLNQEYGEYFFKINRDSFERTMFITNEDITIGSTTEINRKLNNYIEGIDSNESFDDAIKNLDVGIKKYNTTQPKLIPTLKKEIKELNNHIRLLEEKKNLLPKEHDEYHKLEKDIDDLNAQIKKEEEKKSILEKWEQIELWDQDINKIENEINELNIKYGGNIPQEEEVKDIEDKYKDYINIKDQEVGDTLSLQDEQELIRLQNDVFQNGLVNQDEVESIRKNIKEEGELSSKIKSLNEKDEALNQALNKSIFIKGIPGENVLTHIQNLKSEYQDLENKKEDEVINNKTKNNKGLLLILGIISCLILIGGIVGLVFNLMIVGLVLVLISLLGFGVMGFLYLNKKMVHQNMVANQKDKNLLRKQEILDRLNEELQTYNYHIDNYLNMNSVIDNFIKDVQEFKNIQKELEDNTNNLSIIKHEETGLIDKIEVFFKRFNINSYNEEYSKLLENLLLSENNYKNLIARKNEMEKQQEELKNKQEEKKQILLDVLKKRSIAYEEITSKVKQMNYDIRLYNSLIEQRKMHENNINLYKNKYHLEEKPTISEIDLKALESELNNKTQQLANKKSEIREIEDEVDLLEDKKQELNEKEELMKKYEEEKNILEETKRGLETANKQLKEKYIGPVRKIFLKHASILKKTFKGDITINDDFKTRFVADGQEHSDEYLSQGQRTILAFCFRLALIQNMFSNDMPFLVLDDPFVHLDGDHINNIKALVKEISSSMQVLYFTCHDSRDLR